MSAQTKYRQAFLSVRSLLQQHDPYGLVRKYGGDRFDDELYGYEATTLIEFLKGDPSAEKVSEILEAVALKNGRAVNVEEYQRVAIPIAEVLGAL